jgi:hypothetical protein
MVPLIQAKTIQEFCKLWDITHNTGIPYNPQGQAIVELQHQKIKKQLIKIKKGEFTSQVFTCSITSYPINFKFFLTWQPSHYTYEKHFHA